MPLVEKDLSIIVDCDITWNMIKESIEKRVKELEFVEEYYGDQIPDGKKSIMLRVKLGDGKSTMTSDEIAEAINGIVKALNKKCGAILREE